MVLNIFLRRVTLYLKNGDFNHPNCFVGIGTNCLFHASDCSHIELSSQNVDWPKISILRQYRWLWNQDSKNTWFLEIFDCWKQTISRNTWSFDIFENFDLSKNMNSRMGCMFCESRCSRISQRLSQNFSPPKNFNRSIFSKFINSSFFVVVSNKSWNQVQTRYSWIIMIKSYFRFN